VGRRSPHPRLLLAAAIALLAAPRAGSAGDPAAAVPVFGTRSAPLPLVREARYRMSAAVRPLLIFWIHAGNVGGARIRWFAGSGDRRGYELLIGSDPLRAPRRINRWGWEQEEAGPDGATVLGVMRKTDEDSLDEARSGLAHEGKGGFIFKSIRTRLVGDYARAENVLWRVPHDYCYRDIQELLALVGSPPPSPPRVREARLPERTRPGFLFAVAGLIDEAVTAAVAPGPARRLLAGRSVTFTFNASLYDLTLRETRWLDTAEYGGRRYERLVRLSFEHFNRDKGTRERFRLVCPTDGPLARVPVFVEYQPKWWFKAEGVLDDSEVFPETTAPAASRTVRVDGADRPPSP
jgi:hypothetical protein